MQALIPLLPILLFLAIFWLLAGFKIASLKWVGLCFLWGLLAALLPVFVLNDVHYALAPALEEVLKGLLIFYMVRTARIGFASDGILYGAATGAGYACVALLHTTSWVDGVGATAMHLGCTALTALLLVLLAQKRLVNPLPFLLLLLPAYGINLLYHTLPLSPIASTSIVVFILLMLIVPLCYLIRTRWNRWMDLNMAEEVAMLAQIRKGTFNESPSGQYLMRIRHQFKPDVVFDMYCYIALYLELSLANKRTILCKEAGVPVPATPDWDSKWKEFKILRKRIGPSGLSVLSPICTPFCKK